MRSTSATKSDADVKLEAVYGLGLPRCSFVQVPPRLATPFSCIYGEFIGDSSPNVSMGPVGNDAGLFPATEEKMAETPSVQVVQDLGWKEAL